jgi:hypothetical protein
MAKTDIDHGLGIDRASLSLAYNNRKDATNRFFHEEIGNPSSGVISDLRGARNVLHQKIWPNLDR